MEKVDLRTKTVLIIDHGIFCSWAERLAREFGRVLYYNDWATCYPSSKRYRIGHGLKGVESVAHLWEAAKEADLIVALDVYSGDEVDELRRQGKRVWGAGKIHENLEIDRKFSRETMQSLGMPVTPWREIIGIDNLKKYLDKNIDKHIKISITRNDMESWSHKDKSITQDSIDDMLAGIGTVMGKIQPFIVEDDIPSPIEAGGDGPTVYGQFPKDCLQAYEMKDIGAITTHQPWEKLPAPVRFINEKIAPWLKANKYTGDMSTEIRVGKDGKFYCIDWTLRKPFPPGNTHQEIVSNWGYIMYEGAVGRLVEPEYTALYGVEVIIESDRAMDAMATVRFPKEIDQWVKLVNCCVIDGVKRVIPQDYKQKQIGSIVGLGDTLIDAIKNVKKNADQVKGFKLKIDMDSIADAVAEISIGIDKYGYDFGDNKIPTVEQVAKILNGDGK